jgi:hypothetical protein
MRPFVTWSKVEKRFASRNGGSNEVDAVIPKANFFVTYEANITSQHIGLDIMLGPVFEFHTAAIAEMGMVGSVIGHCAALRIQSSRLPW